jgi:glycogenin glucosyltransferase
MTVEDLPREGEDVYASILLTDTYLPGALVLAHSLRDAGTTKKLAILVTHETVSDEVVTQLETVYDYVIPIDRVVNERTADNLALMDRPDLHSTFSKIHLWRQTQFRKIVYIDADVVAYRAPDELFDLPYPFAAAPDVGWPDLFNSGVMVLTPNIGDYHGLSAMAERGVSFDGADQGLLNLYFKNFHRISFTYNVTPAPFYTYVPAYRHFESSISMVHFIGALKPWVQGRDITTTTTSGTPIEQMYGRWWAVYDRHYKNDASDKTGGAPDIVRYFVKGEFNPDGQRKTPTGSNSFRQDSLRQISSRHHSHHQQQHQEEPWQPWREQSSSHEKPSEQQHEEHYHHNFNSQTSQSGQHQHKQHGEHTKAREGSNRSPTFTSWDASR